MIYRMSDSREQLIDEILVMDCQSGSTKAMEMLVSRWQKRLWQYAFSLTADAEAAWDITQETWLGIIKGLRKLRDPASFKAWAYRIATNKSIDWMKITKAGSQISVEEINEHQHKTKKDIGLKELLEKLDIRRKTVLSLYYFERLSIREISVALNIPDGTVKSRLANARQEVKLLWQQHFGPD